MRQFPRPPVRALPVRLALPQVPPVHHALSQTLRICQSFFYPQVPKVLQFKIQNSKFFSAKVERRISEG